MSETTDEMPKEILAWLKHPSWASGVWIAKGVSYLEEERPAHYHHDSILQAKDREIAELNTRIATLEKSNKGYVNLEKYVQDWLIKLEAGEESCFDGAFRLIYERIKTLEKQLEGKIHDC